MKVYVYVLNRISKFSNTEIYLTTVHTYARAKVTDSFTGNWRGRVWMRCSTVAFSRILNFENPFSGYKVIDDYI